MLFFSLLFIRFYPVWGHLKERNDIFQKSTDKEKFPLITWASLIPSGGNKYGKKEWASGCSELLHTDAAHQSEEGDKVSGIKARGSRSPAGLWAAGEPQMVLLQPEELHSRKFWPFQEFLRVIPGSAKSSRSYRAKELDGVQSKCVAREVLEFLAVRASSPVDKGLGMLSMCSGL